MRGRNQSFLPKIRDLLHPTPNSQHIALKYTTKNKLQLCKYLCTLLSSLPVHMHFFSAHVLKSLPDGNTSVLTWLLPAVLCIPLVAAAAPWQTCLA